MWFLCIYLFIFVFLKAAPVAYGSSLARGLIGAIAAAYTTATTMPDPSRVCDLHHTSRQCWILNPLSEARDRTHNLMDPSQIRFCCAMTGTPYVWFFEKLWLLQLLHHSRIDFISQGQLHNLRVLVQNKNRGPLLKKQEKSVVKGEYWNIKLFSFTVSPRSCHSVFFCFFVFFFC